MKGLINILFRLSFFIIILLAISCKKEDSTNDQNEKVYSVNFKFNGFADAAAALPKANSKATHLVANAGNAQNNAEGYLYYWSFNKDNLLPDISYNYLLKPSITYANREVPNSYVNSSFANENFAAGRAITFTGIKAIVIKLPIKEVRSLSSLGFDVGSSNTGAKDFEILYSVDKGVLYNTLAANNQFGNTDVVNQKHSYTYDLGAQNIAAEELWIKINPKSGERGASAAFNESTGVLRMDNLYLSGVAATTPSDISVSKLHYFLFNNERPEIVISGEQDLETVNSLDLALPLGSYSVCFLSNASSADLIMPEKPTVASFYAANIFSNGAADIFGYVGVIEVYKAQSNEIQLQRLYRQIKIEFTDSFGLDQITKVVIDQGHDPFFFAPFNAELTNPILDQSAVARNVDFSANKQFVFNQFLGILDIPAAVSYRVLFYQDNNLLRTLNLSSSLLNNMQLVFRGSALSGVDQNNTFLIIRNETWSGETTVDF